ncbi:MAG TPA: threonine synthase [Candidatus Margulisbacteria bacterium]|nr:MAG: threonine synthase [Candidatus Margulisbacteria bacterium GWD2_39_127]HAR61917.1 threonine synthase [Candidatus Margulisiibacteriota bacterium]
MSWPGLIENYREYLPVSDKTPIVTLLEGNTPLIKTHNLTNYLNTDINIYLKFEGLNPTGSFKDRGMTLAITKAVEAGSKAVMCASTGNTSASAAAYAARSGIQCIVLIPDGNIALGKLSQALMHGAKVLAIKGNFDDALLLVKDITDNYPITMVNSLNPYRIEGQKTGAFEIIEQLGGIAPEYHAIPVGNAGNITAYWKGYNEFFNLGKIKTLPKMIGFQAAGSAPIVDGHPIKDPKTIATAIKIGNPASWKSAEAARDESGGLIEKVTDEEITEAQLLLAKLEGVFCEPASAASVAGVIKKLKAGYFPKNASVVCILTGHGVKDPNRAVEIAPKPIVIEADKALILKEIGL